MIFNNESAYKKEEARHINCNKEVVSDQETMLIGIKCLDHNQTIFYSGEGLPNRVIKTEGFDHSDDDDEEDFSFIRQSISDVEQSKITAMDFFIRMRDRFKD